MFVGYYARLQKGNDALFMIREIFRRIVKCNMASVMSDQESMWMGTWEIDGNTGLTAAMTEMFVQCVKDEILLLPALPEKWQQGSIKGVALKGAGTLDIYWENGKLQRAEILFEEDTKRQIFYNGKKISKEFQAKERTEILL